MEGQIFQIVQWTVGILFGGSIVGTFMFYRAKKRTENANAGRAENEVQSGCIDNKLKLYKAQDEIIEGLSNDLEDLNKKFSAYSKANIKLETRLTELEETVQSNQRKIDQLTNERCIVEDCPKRNPPRITEQKCKECNGEISEQL